MLRDLRVKPIGALAGAGLLAALALTGCGGGGAAAGPTTGAGAQSAPATSAPASQAAPAASSKPATPHNEADIAFASTMIPHNVQVLATTQIASAKAAQPQVKSLAGKLSAAQVPQIETLSAWLTNWGAPVPAGGAATKAGTGITQADLNKLSQAPAGGFDKLWLTTMIAHQQRAVTAAKAEVAGGSSAEAKALAQKILAEQQAQIATMKGLLAKA